MAEGDEKKPDIPWNVAGLAGSLATFATGLFCLLDDSKDFGKFGDERNPPMPHHWIYGCVLIGAGVVGLGLTLLDLLSKTPPPPVPAKKLPPSLLEGAPEEVIEKFK